MLEVVADAEKVNWPGTSSPFDSFAFHAAKKPPFKLHNVNVVVIF